MFRKKESELQIKKKKKKTLEILNWSNSFKKCDLEKNTEKIKILHTFQYLINVTIIRGW